MKRPARVARLLALLHAVPLFAGCRTAPPPPPAPAAIRPGRAADAPATVQESRAPEEPHAAAESRRIQAFQRLRQGQDAERAGRFAEARNLYAEALELDPNNAAARDGRERMRAALAEPPPAATVVPRNINGGEHRYHFNTAVEEARSALAAAPPRPADARAAWQRAVKVKEEHSHFLPPIQMQTWQDTLSELDQSIRNVEDGARRRLHPGTAPTSNPTR